jgi:DNA polymerase
MSSNEFYETAQALENYLRFCKEIGIGELPAGFAAGGTEIEDTEKNGTALLSGRGKARGSSVQTLSEIREELGDCTRCRLCETRKNIVFGEGNPRARLVFVGEGPGRDEDIQGRPFVGRAGQLLTKIIQAMKLERKDVYICNVVKCRPPGNRNPEPDEVASCEPFLIKQIESINPEVIVSLGSVATGLMLKLKNFKMGQLRGTFHQYGNSKLMITYHPAALLRNPAFKKPVWEDMKLVMKELGIPVNG